jgi:hypothetical protein
LLGNGESKSLLLTQAIALLLLPLLSRRSITRHLFFCPGHFCGLNAH